MTPEKINIAIAKVLGRTQESIDRRLDWELAVRQLQWAEITTEEFYRRHLRVDPTPEPLTDYYRSLDAMHEAEKFLNVNQQTVFVQNLENIVSRDLTANLWSWALLHATAAQRAETFLKTLNLWEEE